MWSVWRREGRVCDHEEGSVSVKEEHAEHEWMGVKGEERFWKEEWSVGEGRRESVEKE